MLKELTNSNWQLYFLMTCAAILPTGITILPFAMVWFFMWMVTGEYKNFKPNIWFYTFEAFFILYALGIFYSHNIPAASLSIQWKLSFFFYPFLMNTVRLNPIRLNLTFLMFVISNVFIGIFLLIRLFVKVALFDSKILTYSKYTFFTHPSYISLFMIWSMVIIFLVDFKASDNPKTDRNLRYTCLGILFVNILFCSSKIGIITLALVLITQAVSYFRQTKDLKTILKNAVILLSTAYIFGVFVPSPFQRFIVGFKSYQFEVARQEEDPVVVANVDVDSTLMQQNMRIANPYGNGESTAARMSIWKHGMEIVPANFFFGVGTGDVTGELVKVYIKYGMEAARKHRLNAHNQFLETQLGVGIFGLIAVSILTIGFFIYSIRKKYLFAFIFSGLMLVNLAVESMFQWEVACAFFTFFMMLVLRNEELPEN